MKLQLSKQQEQLLQFVKEQHGEQKRKYTGEPYWTHPVSVALRLQKYYGDTPIYKEVALCHDLFEDTECNEQLLKNKLLEIGYTKEDTQIIIDGVYSLTDLFTKEIYPHLNRQKRKCMEVKRLSNIDPLFKDVKCADLIDNTSSIVNYDPIFAEVYLEEKEAMLLVLSQADRRIYWDAIYTLRKAQNKLSKMKS